MFSRVFHRLVEVSIFLMKEMCLQMRFIKEPPDIPFLPRSCYFTGGEMPFDPLKRFVLDRDMACFKHPNNLFPHTHVFIATQTLQSIPSSLLSFILSLMGREETFRFYILVYLSIIYKLSSLRRIYYGNRKAAPDFTDAA